MTDQEREGLNRLSEAVIGAAMEVQNTLGAGFLEKVYERALAHELRLRGHVVLTQAPLEVYYKGELVGEYCADLLVEGKLIVELKCCRALTDEHLAQTLNYLTGTKLHLALVINFQKSRLEWKRVVRDF